MYRCKWRVYSKESTENGELVFVEPRLKISNLPFYLMEQVSKHNNVMYDVSQFVKIHSGGDIILLEAGNFIELFWRFNSQHETQQVFELLEIFRIGNLREEDRLKPSDIQVSDPSDEYISKRNPVLITDHDKC
ncbi:hypothetical protein RDWZM_010491 [Blomia tropicalis]|uniref:Cytochrome b5 heme-binding domain-containing protein n=1 Tax=Blomia tropicalis TaxID=40697 RepID=A0A9Q0RIT9_BLOTA|nr:hypothetical protein RDWZM_010491 [Blomia tropicalis]